MSQPVQLGRNKAEAPETHVDPVCKMLVTPETAASSYEYNGETYYFCNPNCKDKFAADPQKYLGDTHEHSHDVVEHGEMSATPGGKFTAPVCGMSVSAETAAGMAEHNGQTFYFCSTGCETKFKSDPDKYLQTRRLEDLPQDAEYTCPMHPQIV